MSSVLSSRREPAPAPRIAAFEKLGFGLFLHWGLYSLLGRGEWIRLHEDIPAKSYVPLMEKFTAEDFDAAAVARLARRAGMRYACLTTRHHDGFSLYDTRGLNTFDAPHSAARRDLVAEFVEACRVEGVTPFLYHTTLDWHKNSHTCTPSQFSKYIDYLCDSVEILCTRYGKIGGLWFDGNWSRRDVDWQEGRLYRLIRKHQPEAIIVNNTGLGHGGERGHPEIDLTTFEQSLPFAPDRRGWPKYLAGEMCQTINKHWGVGARDFCYKSPAQLIETLASCRRVGSNYLLNVGPTATGEIPALDKAILEKIGDWCALYEKALYRPKPSPVRCLGRDFVLREGRTLYYFAFELERRGNAHVVQDGGGRQRVRPLAGLPFPVRSGRWLDNGERVALTQDAKAKIAAIDCHGFDYGTDTVVRVAELKG